MPGTFPILELRQDGDVELVRVKQATSKPTLKDIQTYLKKKSAPAILTSYPYGSKRISMIGYTKGNDSETTQHQLPPPYEETTLYGSIILIAHGFTTPWDTSIEQFLPGDYEIFYEKACAGELEEEKDTESETEEVEEVEDVIEEDLEEEDTELVLQEEEAIEEEEPRPRARKVVKIDPQQLQFQFKSTLVTQESVSLDVVEKSKERKAVYMICKDLIGEQCSEVDLLDLELGIYNASLDDAKRRLVPLTWDHEIFKWIYMTIAKRTISNFKPSYVGNTRLIARWKDGEFTLDRLGHWSPYELDPANWKDLKDQQFRREQRILEGNLAMATDRFRCSQCKKKMCSYYELQTRSADEPMTIFISCLNCGKHWKQ